MMDGFVMAMLWLTETVVTYSLGAVVFAMVSVGAYSVWQDRFGKGGVGGDLGRPGEV